MPTNKVSSETCISVLKKLFEISFLKTVVSTPVGTISILEGSQDFEVISKFFMTSAVVNIFLGSR